MAAFAILIPDKKESIKEDVCNTGVWYSDNQGILIEAQLKNFDVLVIQFCVWLLMIVNHEKNLKRFNK